MYTPKWEEFIFDFRNFPTPWVQYSNNLMSTVTFAHEVTMVYCRCNAIYVYIKV